jgi:hypothetical protein
MLGKPGELDSGLEFRKRGIWKRLNQKGDFLDTHLNLHFGFLLEVQS